MCIRDSAATEQYGYGLSSVRFICGTQTVHKQLEKAIADFLGMEDAILYAAAVSYTHLDVYKRQR